MPFAEVGPDLVAVPVMQHHHGTNQVRAIVGAAGMGAMTVDALGGVDLLAAVGGGRIHDVFVIGARAACVGATPAASRRLGAHNHRRTGRDGGHPRTLCKNSPIR